MHGLGVCLRLGFACERADVREGVCVKGLGTKNGPKNLFPSQNLIFAPKNVLTDPQGGGGLRG